MLTAEENEFFTRVGPGTPAGEFLRRYWHPVAFVPELSDESPTFFVRILGEDLVLFKDKSGRVGLLADHCSHRGASLLYGRVEERGIACAYHGWLYDCEGNILETPPERNEAIMNSVKHKAYAVQEFIGMYWAYLGPQPAPVIPRYDIWTRKDGRLYLYLQPRLDCNWLQPMENSADPAHAPILHQDKFGSAEKVTSTTRGRIDEFAGFDVFEAPIGLMKQRHPKESQKKGERSPGGAHPVIFPNMLRQANSMQIRVPIDDTHTKVIFVRFEPRDAEASTNEDALSISYLPPYKNPPDQLHPFTKFDMDWDVQSQDHMAWETQGPIADRTKEHLSYSDKGVVMLRKMLKREIQKVSKGLDPIGIVRDPDHEMIDTNLEQDLQRFGGRIRPQHQPDRFRQSADRQPAQPVKENSVL